MFLRGARQHNLKRVDLELPDHRLVVITGVSGSGKSSLAFDTLYREGQRRYLETLSFASRQHLAKLDRPAAEQIGDLRPAVAVDQRTVIRTPRSTVGTLTELHPHLRLLFARLGQGEDDPTGRPPLESSLFSFNAPAGQCPRRKGLGVEDRVDPALLVGEADKTI
ncbi:MAG: hypothetical protein JRI68_33235, partial [Deltaproteobacteria bacterium]|nr:hypothetical protein [Deltaproteobacteria bacterium]